MTWDRRRHRNAAVALAVAVLLILGLAACGDDDDAEQDAAGPTVTTQADAEETPAEPTAELCTARDELTGTVEALGEIEVVEDGTDALEEALSDVRGAVDDVDGAAGADLGDEVDAVQSALDEMQAAIDSFDEADAPSAAIAAVSRAVTELATVAGALGDEMRDGCE